MNRFKIPTPQNTKTNNNDKKVLLDKLVKMVKEHPNNYTLGKEIREYVNKLSND